MTDLIVRKLEIDLSAGFARHWHGGAAFFHPAMGRAVPSAEQLASQWLAENASHWRAAGAPPAEAA